MYTTRVRAARLQTLERQGYRVTFEPAVMPMVTRPRICCYLHKPFDLRELDRLVARAIASATRG